MRNITRIYVGFLVVLSVLWLAANPGVFAVSEFIAFRNFMVQYFGVLAIGCMSLIMVLATRPVWLENITGGLDKTCRLHKWLGITALVTATTHWLWANGPKWAVKLGLLDGGRRSPRPDSSPFGSVQAFFASQRGLAEQIGEWAFYGASALMVLALIKWFPYRWFAKTHKFIAVAYVTLVIHTMFLLDFAQWTSPIGLTLAGMLCAGSVSAVMVLAGLVGKHRRVDGQITALTPLPGIDALEVTIAPEAKWQGHQAGQFALVSLSDDEPPHPFTISSNWDAKKGEITLLIKALGDYTRSLPARLTVGDAVKVEGPYGRFVFDRAQDRQIWVAGGIGLTPFLARMEDLAQTGTYGGQQIDFYQVAPNEDARLMAKIENLAKQAGVRLHVWRDHRDGFLTGKRLRGDVPDWHEASVWFCGPQKFGADLRRDLVGRGLAPADFHAELFDFR